MPAPKRKPMPKPVAKRPVKHVTARPAPTPPRPVAKPFTPAQREAIHAIHTAPIQKASPPMMTAADEENRTTPPQSQQAGQRTPPRKPTTKPNGKDAKDKAKEEVKKQMAEAVKNNQAAVNEGDDDDDETPEPEPVTDYPEGDPDKGAIDPENPDRPIAHRDRRAYLVRQAERNQAANDALNAIQVAQNRRIYETTAMLQDPDYMRETSMQTAITALKAHDPEVVAAKHEEMAKRQKAKQDREDKKNGTK